MKPCRLSQPKTSLRWRPLEATEGAEVKVGEAEEEEEEMVGEVKTVRAASPSRPPHPQQSLGAPNTPPSLTASQIDCVIAIIVMGTRHFSVWPHSPVPGSQGLLHAHEGLTSLEEKRRIKIE